MSSNGFLSRIKKSAIAPAATTPRMPSLPSILAGLIVAWRRSVGESRTVARTENSSDRSAQRLYLRLDLPV